MDGYVQTVRCVQKAHNHVQVPGRYPADQELGNWVSIFNNVYYNGLSTRKTYCLKSERGYFKLVWLCLGSETIEMSNKLSD